MLNFVASKPRVKGGGPGPPWIRTCIDLHHAILIANSSVCYRSV